MGHFYFYLFIYFILFYFFCYHDDSADYPGFWLNEAAGLRQGAESGWQREKAGVFFSGGGDPSAGKRTGEGGTRRKEKLLQASLR